VLQKAYNCKILNCSQMERKMNVWIGNFVNVLMQSWSCLCEPLQRKSCMRRENVMRRHTLTAWNRWPTDQPPPF